MTRYRHGMTIEEIAQSFSAQPEARAQHSYLSDPSQSSAREFINEIYNNLFGRDVEPAGLSYWLNDLHNGMPPGMAVLAMINGALGNDAITLQNNLSVGLPYASIVEHSQLRSPESAVAVLDEIDATSPTAFNEHTGNSRMDGGTGNGSLNGVNDNVFVFAANFGRDVIADFGAHSQSQDVVQFSRTVFDDFADVMANAAQRGEDVVIGAGTENALVPRHSDFD